VLRRKPTKANYSTGEMVRPVKPINAFEQRAIFSRERKPRRSNTTENDLNQDSNVMQRSDFFSDSNTASLFRQPAL
jgi:hypothetical protein